MEADRVVAKLPHLIQTLGRRDRHRDDQFLRLLRPHRLQRGDHGRTGRDAVVGHDH
jgi:hypothetical protein